MYTFKSYKTIVITEMLKSHTTKFLNLNQNKTFFLPIISILELTEYFKYCPKHKIFLDHFCTNNNAIYALKIRANKDE